MVYGSVLECSMVLSLCVAFKGAVTTPTTTPTAVLALIVRAGGHNVVGGYGSEVGAVTKAVAELEAVGGCRGVKT